MKGQMLTVSKRRNTDRSPRLDTILMIEKAIYRDRSDKTITQIWRRLPKKVMWATFKTVLEYLVYSGKIYIDKDKTVSWLWDPKGIEKLKKKGLMIK